MIAGINALQVRAAKSGVGQYIHALCEEFAGSATGDKFKVYATPANCFNYSPGGPVETIVRGPQGGKTSVKLLHELLTLPTQLKRDRLSVFHGASNFLPLRKVCPYVVTIHDLSYYVHPERCTPARRRYWYAMTARTVKLADRIITDSENTRRDIARYFPGNDEKVRVIYLAAHQRFCPTEVEKWQLPWDGSLAPISEAPYLLYVGTLEPGKNLLRLLDAFELIAGEHRNLRLVIAGDAGWLFQDIVNKATATAFSDRIHITGHLPDEQIVQLYQFAEALVYPSLYEGFGMPPLEAMQCGTPVITSNTSSIPEVVGDAAVLVDPTQTKALAEAMRQLLASQALRRQLRERGLARATEFSWLRTAQQTLDVYREVADEGVGRV